MKNSERKIKAWLEQSGLKQHHLANRLGIREQSCNRLLKGHLTPRPALMLKLCRIVPGLEPNDFYDWKPVVSKMDYVRTMMSTAAAEAIAPFIDEAHEAHEANDRESSAMFNNAFGKVGG